MNRFNPAVTNSVGLSGAGKTTIFDLVCGFYEVKSGQLVVLGRDIKEWNLEALRSNVSYVSQDTYLFPDTIYENIRYGNPAASREEVYEASKNAFAHDFILGLKDIYDTQVGERGLRLSAGQRQRIAMARAFLRNTPILLLDEPTASLDAHSETLVQQALESIVKGRCVLVAAHRLMTIRRVEQIFVLNDGRIAEAGTHEILMKKDGIYTSLFNKQFTSQAHGGKQHD